MWKLFFLCSILMFAGQTQAEPAPFRAVYKADYKGLPVSAVGVRELTRLDNNQYRLTSSAKTFFASIVEETTFAFEENAPKPINYQYKRSGIGKNKNVDMTFDWNNNTVADLEDPDEWQLDLTPGMLDKLLYQFKMRGDLQRASESEGEWPDMTYQIADNGRLKTYDFKVTGTEAIETPVGTIETVKAIRVRDNKDRSTTFWMAPDYDFMLVRLLQVEKNGEGFELLLKEAEYDGKRVQGN